MSKIKTITGSPFNDILYADRKKVSKVYGLEGNDTITGSFDGKHKGFFIYGGKGNAKITASGARRSETYGEEGDDNISAYISSNSRIYGGTGNDLIWVNIIQSSKGSKDIIIDGGDGDDIIDYRGLTSNSAYSRTRGKDINVYGGEGDDTIKISGLRFDDSTMFHGGKGDDFIDFMEIP